MVDVIRVLGVVALWCGVSGAWAQAPAIDPGAIERPDRQLELDPAAGPPLAAVSGPQQTLTPVPAAEIWITPVLRQRGTADDPALRNAAQVRVAGRAASRGERRLEQVESSLRLQEEEQKSDPVRMDTVKDADESTDRAAVPRNRIEQARTTPELDAVDPDSLDEERRLCAREPRNGIEGFLSVFGVRFQEECPSSRRRRETIRVTQRSAITARNTIYAINPAAEEIRVTVSCRAPATGATFGATLSVEPLGIGRFEPPCACDADYEFWCAVYGSAPFLAHGILEQRSAAQDSDAYITFTPAAVRTP